MVSTKWSSDPPRRSPSRLVLDDRLLADIAAGHHQHAAGCAEQEMIVVDACSSMHSTATLRARARRNRPPVRASSSLRRRSSTMSHIEPSRSAAFRRRATAQRRRERPRNVRTHHGKRLCRAVLANCATAVPPGVGRITAQLGSRPEPSGAMISPRAIRRRPAIGSPRCSVPLRRRTRDGARVRARLGWRRNPAGRPGYGALLLAGVARRELAHRGQRAVVGDVLDDRERGPQFVQLVNGIRGGDCPGRGCRRRTREVAASGGMG